MRRCPPLLGFFSLLVWTVSYSYSLPSRDPYRPPPPANYARVDYSNDPYARPPPYAPQDEPRYNIKDDPWAPVGSRAPPLPNAARKKGVKRRPREGRGPEMYGENGEPDDEADTVDKYCSTHTGKAMVTLSSGAVGAILGGTISASTIHRPIAFISGGLALGIILSLFRNDFGELFRALGLGLIFFLQRSDLVGSQYRILSQLRAAARLGPRRPFPPGENPWTYVRITSDQVEFSMLKAIIAVGFVGVFAGFSVGKIIGFLLFPPWLIALLVGLFFSYTSTLRDAKGDLLRCIGMRIVSFVGALKEIDEEVLITTKLGRVFHISYRHAAKIDQKYGVRSKVGSAIGKAYDAVSVAARQIQDDMSTTNTGGGGGVGGRVPMYDDPYQQASAPPYDDDRSSYGRR